ncbi:mitochondrial ribosomal protein subunit L20-domain-containing protein [Cokeromyces recurvatus]|uniref:mitochondrial ribosomal protein subunit L20-domain-containing protein n=1 Tax=Cokeromyces recurvatus TaxID=90255 RepID=UPI00221E4AA1|nr:mitochondrial ribosomal protein subunit L20-domain-containing protein [Cokeromyces recurvatus]KAI7903668.1 mitochondrial ribosomal protein subunit L20-domain-containing protein [Cokeromyces recurvatus]
MNNSSRCIFNHVRTYATKSKTPNLKMKPSVPIQETKLPDGITFITRLPVVEPSVQSEVAPLIHKSGEPKKILTDAEINEMRQLRDSDPETWTRSKLAKKFGCSNLFVSIAAPLKENKVTNEVIANERDGHKRKLIAQERQKRRALW